MRNRAKCAECKEILESLSWGDVVTCKCGLQTIWGGNQALHTSSRDYSKFLRVDDEGNEVSVRLIDKGDFHAANLGLLLAVDTNPDQGIAKRAENQTQAFKDKTKVPAETVVFIDYNLDEGSSLEPSQSPMTIKPLSPIASSPLDELQAFKDYLDRWPAARLHSPCSYADLRDLSGLVLSALQSPPL